jgi:hypothetical protein
MIAPRPCSRGRVGGVEITLSALVGPGPEAEPPWYAPRWIPLRRSACRRSEPGAWRIVAGFPFHEG